MGSMMNGWHFDHAKEGNNEYGVRANQFLLISHATYASALDVFKENKRVMLAGKEYGDKPYSVELIKEYDGKTKKYMEEIIRIAK